jgi:hypothetical protein
MKRLGDTKLGKRLTRLIDPDQLDARASQHERRADQLDAEGKFGRATAERKKADRLREDAERARQGR